MKRKFAAIALAIAMVFTMMPMTHLAVAYADTVDIPWQLTDTDLTWDAPEGGENFQISVFGQCVQDDEDGPDYTGTSFPRNKLDKYIINHVYAYGLEIQDTYEVIVTVASSDGGVLGYANVAYPNPIDGKIRDVSFEDGYLYWDDYYPYTFKIYANDVYLGSGDLENGRGYFNIDDELEYAISFGRLKKSSDNLYTIRIDDVEGDDNIIATWEGQYAYETDTENPYFTDIAIEDEELYWDEAPYSDYIDVCIDGARVRDIDNYSSVPSMIDKLVQSGKLDKSVTNHEIKVQAYQYNESGEGEDYFLYEWTTTYEYASDKEMLTSFPEDMAIDEWGNVEWSYFKDVDHFNYYINEYVNDYYIRESIELKNEIDNGISNGWLAKADDGKYNFKLEGVDENGTVLDTFEGVYTYESQSVAPADKLYYMEVFSDEEYNQLVWNKVNDVERYELYVSDVLVDEYVYGTNYSCIKEKIDNMIRNSEIAKAENNIYTIKLNALKSDWNENDEYVTEVISSKTYDYEYVTDVAPALDHFESVKLYLEDDEDYYYRHLVWNEIKNADYYEVSIGEYLDQNNNNVFDLCNFIDKGIRNGMIEKSDEYTVTIKAYDSDGELITSYEGSFAYSSDAQPVQDHFIPEEVSVVLDNESWMYGWLKWNPIKNAEFYYVTIDGYTFNEHVLQEYCDFYYMVDEGIQKEYFPSVEDHTVTIKAYRYVTEDYSETEELASYTTTFHYASDEVPAADSLVDVKFVYDEEDKYWTLKWNKVNGAESYKITVNGVYNDECEYYGEYISSLIDSLIEDGYIENTGSFEVKLEALDENGVTIGDAWTGTLEYKSNAEPKPLEFVFNEFESWYDAGYLSWKSIRFANWYTITVQGKSYMTWDTSLELYDFIDEKISRGEIENQNSYELTFKAYQGRESGEGEVIAEASLNFEYASSAIPPTDHFVNDYIKINNERQGRLIWNSIIGADYYRVTIDGYSETTLALNYDLYDRIDELTQLEYIEDKADHTIKLEALKYADADAGESDNDISLCEPWEGTASYRAAQEAIITIDENGMLNIKYKDGSEPENFDYGWIMCTNTGSSDQYISEIPFNVNEKIDIMIQGDKAFEKLGTYDLYVYAFNSNGREIFYGEYKGYEYDSPAEYIEPVQMTVTKNGSIVSWDLVEGTDEYNLEIEEGSLSYSFHDPISEYDVENMVDILISEKMLDPREDGIYTFIVSAYNEKEVLIGKGSLVFEYHSTVVPAGELEVELDGKGNLTWEAVDGASFYRVGVYGEYEQWTDETTVNIHKIIDEGIVDGSVQKSSTYDLCVRAYGENDILLKEWVQFNYEYESSAEPGQEPEHEHHFGPWSAVNETYHQRVCMDDPSHIETEEHMWNEGVVVKEATCTAAGEKKFTCSVCGYTKTEEIPAKGHVEEILPGKEATCTEDGLTEGKKCSVCGEILVAQEVIPAAHDWGTHIEPASLSEPGVTMQQCKVCGETKDVVVIASPKTISLSKTKYVYTGSAVKPKVTIKDTDGKVIDAANYTVTYPKTIGKPKVKVTFNGQYYTGTMSKAVTINPPAVTGLKLTSPKSKQLKVTYKKAKGGVKYQIAYRLKGTTKWKTVTITGTSKLIKKLKGGKTYQVRVRAIKTVSGKKYTGKWTAIKSLKVKK
ncbi:MAG: fibronectin type III domain-containing protein [Firmicutes bacterium]|nr:fibronectin type III domain-containing protein [Bacillota bacterium]